MSYKRPYIETEPQARTRIVVEYIFHRNKHSEFMMIGAFSIKNMQKYHTVRHTHAAKRIRQEINL